MNASEAVEFAQELAVDYGLRDWKVELDNAVRRFGCCHHSRKLITLSRHLIGLNDQVQVLDTILHEIAHALAGPGAHHGPEWKRVARAIGCSAERCYSESVIQPSPRYFLRCSHCGHTAKRVRAPRQKLACGICCSKYSGGRFDPRYILGCESAATQLIR
jgi:predicted SprT family Zn-dependent metalloprotease